MAVLGRFSVLLGWNPGPVVVLCLGGTLCKFPQRYIDHKLQDATEKGSLDPITVVNSNQKSSFIHPYQSFCSRLVSGRLLCSCLSAYPRFVFLRS